MCSISVYSVSLLAVVSILAVFCIMLSALGPCDAANQTKSHKSGEKISIQQRKRFTNAERNLVNYLLKDYDQRVRPVIFANETVNVTFGFSLSQLIDVDEKNQIITTNAWLNINWMDINLIWDPANFDNISVIHLPYRSIWLPDIILYNNAESAYSLATLSTNVIVQWDGNVTWLSTNIFESACLINVKWFPFDQQFCDMIFASWTYSNRQLDIGLVTDKMDSSNYMRNTEWDLKDITGRRNDKNYSCCPDVTFPDVTFTINIKRKPLFYVFNMLLPCVIITYVALLGFLVPAESGEKVTMGITTLLSMTVFLMLVCEQLPPNSQSLPMIGIYYGVSISIVSLATGFTVLTLNVHNMGKTGKVVPYWLRILCFRCLNRLLCLTIDLPESQQMEELHVPIHEDGPPAFTYTQRLSNLWESWRRRRSSYPNTSTTDQSGTYPGGPTLGNMGASHTSNPNKLFRGNRHLNTTFSTTYTFNHNSRSADSPSPRKNAVSMRLAANLRARFDNHGAAIRLSDDHLHETEMTSMSGGPGGQSCSRPGTNYPPPPPPPPLLPRRLHLANHSPYNTPHLPQSQQQQQQHAPHCPAASSTSGASNTATSPLTLNIERQLQQVLQRVNRTIERSELRWSDQESRNMVCREWHEVARVLDRLFLLIFVTLTTGVTASLIIEAMTEANAMTYSDIINMDGY